MSEMSSVSPMLTERQNRMVENTMKEMVVKYGQHSDEWWAGMLAGYKAARQAMYLDFDSFWTTDPKAARLAYEGLAIERLSLTEGE